MAREVHFSTPEQQYHENFFEEREEMIARVSTKPVQTGEAAVPQTLGRLLRADEGQDLAEYAILIGLIALVVIAAVTLFGGNLVAMYQNIAATLPF